MAQAVDTDEKVARFRREVLPRLVEKFRPSKVLVFGSRARGDALKHSDLDVLIVAEAFRKIPWLDRPVGVYRECNIRFGVELLCYTPEEYGRRREELGIVRAATEEGWSCLKARGAGSTEQDLAVPGKRRLPRPAGACGPSEGTAPCSVLAFEPRLRFSGRCRLDYVALFGAIAQTLASTLATIVVVTRGDFLAGT